MQQKPVAVHSVPQMSRPLDSAPLESPTIALPPHHPVPSPFHPPGRFEKGMKVKVARTGRVVTLSAPQRMFANERQTVEEGYAGDVIGLTNPGAFGGSHTQVPACIIRTYARQRLVG